jgi:hypothetical protein
MKYRIEIANSEMEDAFVDERNCWMYKLRLIFDSELTKLSQDKDRGGFIIIISKESKNATVT